MSPRLHLLCSADAAAWRDCLGQVARTDRVLLLDRGVECLLDAAFMSRLQKQPMAGWHVLQADARARSLAAAAEGRLVDDAGWVRLIEAHEQVLSWT